MSECSPIKRYTEFFVIIIEAAKQCLNTGVGNFQYMLHYMLYIKWTKARSNNGRFDVKKIKYKRS